MVYSIKHRIFDSLVTLTHKLKNNEYIIKAMNFPRRSSLIKVRLAYICYIYQGVRILGYMTVLLLLLVHTTCGDMCLLHCKCSSPMDGCCWLDVLYVCVRHWGICQLPYHYQSNGLLLSYRVYQTCQLSVTHL